MKEEQDRQRALMEKVLLQISNLASSYNSLVQMSTRFNSGEGSSGNTHVKMNANALFDGQGGIHARKLCLDFPCFDGGDPMSGF